MTKRAQHVWKMVFGLIFAAVSAVAATLGAVHEWVYTRDEGSALERRVDSVEGHYREDLREVRSRLDAIWGAVKKGS